jgi:hypothetical protein
VLPRYFNHSSFASLRRQLNYFSFVRLGKGRQRESTYVNENVVKLDDILHLKRRSTTGNPGQVDGGTASFKERLFDSLADGTSHGAGSSSNSNSRSPALTLSNSSDSSEKSLERRQKRRCCQTSETMPTTVSPRSASPLENYPISDDDGRSSQEPCIVLDLTKPELKADEDFFAGCKNLLYLASKVWE